MQPTPLVLAITPHGGMRLGDWGPIIPPLGCIQCGVPVNEIPSKMAARACPIDPKLARSATPAQPWHPKSTCQNGRSGCMDKAFVCCATMESARLILEVDDDLRCAPLVRYARWVARIASWGKGS